MATVASWERRPTVGQEGTLSANAVGEQGGGAVAQVELLSKASPADAKSYSADLRRRGGGQALPTFLFS